MSDLARGGDLSYVLRNLQKKSSYTPSYEATPSYFSDPGVLNIDDYSIAAQSFENSDDYNQTGEDGSWYEEADNTLGVMVDSSLVEVMGKSVALECGSVVDLMINLDSCSDKGEVDEESYEDDDEYDLGEDFLVSIAAML